MNSTYLIYEFANSHGGDLQLLNQILESLPAPTEELACGVKFQPFKYDLIALPDFSYYPVYEGLFFSQLEWKTIVEKARNHSYDVWLDIFDLYGVEVLQNNLSEITGIKLQASVLDNYEIIEALGSLKLDSIQLMLNVSGYPLSKIEDYYNRFLQLGFQKIVLQVGFQSYPTQVEDSGIQKIATLQKQFPGIPLCFADHSDGNSPMAFTLPLIALSLGCEFIEKHVCLDRETAKYDGFSSFTPAELEQLKAQILELQHAFQSEFINLSESKYLQTTYQIPILRRNLPKGSLVSKSDLVYRRTSQTGLKLDEIIQLQTSGMVLVHDVEAGKALNKEDYKQAKVAVIVAGRMKSSRLKQKAVLPIEGVPSVELCLNACKNIKGATQVILATSTLEEDAVLEENAKNSSVDFWKGDPEDVIARYLGACDRWDIDVIVRVTADCPCVSPEIADFLLQKHFESGADYTASSWNQAIGSCGEIYNVSALRKIVELLGRAEYSEYMTWYMRNNTHIFKNNIVDLPEKWVRDYRLTLDYQEDLDMFSALFRELNRRSLSPGIESVFAVMDSHPEIPKLNGHLTLKYRTDQALIDLLNKATKIHVAAEI